MDLLSLMTLLINVTYIDNLLLQTLSIYYGVIDTSGSRSL